MIAFKKHTAMDYLHHISSAFICAPLATFFLYDKTINLNTIFICGMPGAVNYGLLTAMKHGKISKRTEKKASAYLNNYFRMPGLVSSIYLSYLNTMYNTKLTASSIKIIQFLSIIVLWNATFFNYLACKNYGTYLQKSRRPP